MERIEKALEKARKQRETGHPTATSEGNSPTPDPAARASEGARAERPSQAQPEKEPAGDLGQKTRDLDKGHEVKYSSTRVEKMDPAAAREMRIVAGSARDVNADVFRKLRTQILQKMAAEGDTTLAVTSANPGDGKTLIVANLGVSLAKDVNQTVLLVDLDFRRPGLHRYFGLSSEVGLTDYLAGRAELSDCLVNPGLERLVLLPTVTPVENSSEILSSPRMASLAEELQTRYPDRIIIYDLPPILPSDDALVFVPFVDAVLLVVEEGATKVADITRTMELLSNTRVIGTVLNKSEGGSEAYYYY